MIGSLILVEEICCNCFVHFAMDVALNNQRRAEGGTFYCPNGHAQHYTETEVEKLKKLNMTLKNKAAWAETETEYQKRSHAATKGKLTKLHKRVANGVCPCCNRSFKQLSRHIKNKHPDYQTVVG